jgi:hypothetical protein
MAYTIFVIFVLALLAVMLWGLAWRLRFPLIPISLYERIVPLFFGIIFLVFPHVSMLVL